MNVLRRRASPEIAAYPFTTLMPNLGVLASGKQEAKAQDQYGDLDFLLHNSRLMEGGDAGVWLGRMFLRHLSRTEGLLDVVDASAGLSAPYTMLLLSTSSMPAHAGTSAGVA